MPLRYVILRHEGVAEPHFDLMFELTPGGDLATWRCDAWPIEGRAIARRLGAHRRRYLDYEGPVGGNRGWVQRVAAGEFEWEPAQRPGFDLTLAGENLGLALLQQDGPQWVIAPLKRPVPSRLVPPRGFPIMPAMPQTKHEDVTAGDGAAAPAHYKRVLLKISGEGFCHEGGFGIEADELENIAQQCVDVCRMGVELAIVVGGGNFIRGATFAEDGHIERATADYMGMLSTVINALALQETMESLGQPTRVLSAIAVTNVCEPFIRRRAVRHLEKKRAVILAAGTGNPFFTTDTCAALRATEIQADVLLKATKVDGIYSADPKKDAAAVLYHDISYPQVLEQRLRVMDLTAITLCMERNIPLVVFNLKKAGNIARVMRGEKVGTKIVPQAENNG